jgi:hypothetical protein
MTLITKKSQILLNSILQYYKENNSIFNYFISQKNILSLRILDWLVTNYAKKYNINYNIYKNNKCINFNIYLEYKNQLKAYSKKLFDPFCRRERIVLNIIDLTYQNMKDDEEYYEKEGEILTTVGQLNFFKWFIENNVLEYAINNISKIDNDMIITLNRNKEYPKYKRKELSICASKQVYLLNNNTTISFN